MEDYDRIFYEILYDEDGRSRKVLKEQISSSDESSSGWKTYDTTHGHCGLCGKLACNGRCFK